MAKKLLIATVLFEAPVGVMLLVSPPLVAGLLLGVSLDAPAASSVGRVAGAALLALSVACWLARDDEPSLARRGLIVGILMYNCAATAVLAHAGAVVGLVGVLMWPAVALHAAVAVWCAVAVAYPTSATIS